MIPLYSVAFSVRIQSQILLSEYMLSWKEFIQFREKNDIYLHVMMT